MVHCWPALKEGPSEGVQGPYVDYGVPLVYVCAKLARMEVSRERHPSRVGVACWNGGSTTNIL